MSEDTTNIRISKDTWKELNARKEPGDSFDDVISRLLEEADAGEEGEGNSKPTTATAD